MPMELKRKKRYRIHQLRVFRVRNILVCVCVCEPKTERVRKGKKDDKNNLHNQVSATVSLFMRCMCTTEASRLGIICRVNFLCAVPEPVFFLITFFLLYFTWGWQSIVLFRLLLWSVVVCDRDTEFHSFIYGFALFCIRDFFSSFYNKFFLSL